MPQPCVLVWSYIVISESLCVQVNSGQHESYSYLSVYFVVFQFVYHGNTTAYLKLVWSYSVGLGSSDMRASWSVWAV